MEIKVKGIRDGGSGEEVDIKATRHGSLLESQRLPYGVALTAKGDSWMMMNVTAIAGLVVRPSTLAIVSLWNGEAPGGKSYIIERAFAHELVATAAAGFFGIWLCVHHVGNAALSTALAIAGGGCRGVTNYGGNGVFSFAVGVDDDGWFPWGPGQELPTAAKPGGMADAEINGRIVIPPTAAISLTVVTDTTGSTFTCGFHWHEVQVDLG